MKRLLTCVTPNINITHLIRDRFIQEGAKIKAGKYQISESWMVEISSDLTDPANRIMRVKYEPEPKMKADMEIKIAASPAKYGGVNLFLICPVSDLQTKQLYFCDESMGFVHREVYPKMRAGYPAPPAYPLLSNEKIDSYRLYLKSKMEVRVQKSNEKRDQIFKSIGKDYTEISKQILSDLGQ
ncbi:MAG: hypothetical protein QM737_01425 [Ferruginibacter sp.]